MSGKTNWILGSKRKWMQWAVIDRLTFHSFASAVRWAVAFEQTDTWRTALVQMMLSRSKRSPALGPAIAASLLPIDNVIHQKLQCPGNSVIPESLHAVGRSRRRIKQMETPAPARSVKAPA